MTPSDIRALGDEEALAVATLLGLKIEGEYTQWFVSTGNDSWHEIEIEQKALTGLYKFRTRDALVRRWLEWKFSEGQVT